MEVPRDINEQYRRRKDDEPTTLLILLNERVGNMQGDLKELIDDQANNPCDTHDLRLGLLEKIIWGVVAAVGLLIIEALISVFRGGYG